VAQVLREHDFKQSYALEGGFEAWLNAGGPVEPK
jgi:rhodanese-related sulfurtransferase